MLSRINVKIKSSWIKSVLKWLDLDIHTTLLHSIFQKLWICLAVLIYIYTVRIKFFYVTYFRIKSYEFPEQGLTFEIPRVLCLSDCAIRVLDPKYDHYSPTCKSFYPRQKKKPGISLNFVRTQPLKMQTITSIVIPLFVCTSILPLTFNYCSLLFFA